VEVDFDESKWKLRELSEAAAACRSIDLTIMQTESQVDLADLGPVAASLRHLTCQASMYSFWGSLRGTTAFTSMSQLTSLHLALELIEGEEPWASLASLTGLQELYLEMSATGDPSPFSALTGLTSLKVWSIDELEQPPFRFSSLQPLSTLRQLQVLDLRHSACDATSLQGLAALSNLKQLVLMSCTTLGKLRSLEGISPGLIEFSIGGQSDLLSLAGLECCTSLEKLSLHSCGVSCLQPLRGLGSLKHLKMSRCSVTSLEGLNGMSLQSLSLQSCNYLTQLSGVENLSALKSLEVYHCVVTSLQPLSQLGEGLQKLLVDWCSRVRDKVLKLPHVRPTAHVVVRYSKVKEVVLAGGVTRAASNV
jgi:Leucine-rich repeat (LRR) protein